MVVCLGRMMLVGFGGWVDAAITSVYPGAPACHASCRQSFCFPRRMRTGQDVMAVYAPSPQAPAVQGGAQLRVGMTPEPGAEHSQTEERPPGSTAGPGPGWEPAPMPQLTTAQGCACHTPGQGFAALAVAAAAAACVAHGPSAHAAVCTDANDIMPVLQKRMCARHLARSPHSSLLLWTTAQRLNILDVCHAALQSLKQRAARVPAPAQQPTHATAVAHSTLPLHDDAPRPGGRAACVPRGAGPCR